MAIHDKTLTEAMEEARRFLRAAEALDKRLLESDRGVHIYGFPREIGAVQRSSMDLTRKLADLRAGR